MNFSLDHHPWPIPVLSKLHEPGHDPTAERVKRVQEECITNACSVTMSTLGVAGYGLLGLVVDNATHQAITGQPWDRPDQPGIHPDIPDQATAAQIAEVTRQHQNDWLQYNIMLQTDAKIKQQLLDAADEVYWSPLRQQHTIYGRRTALELLEHMRSEYAELDEDARKTIRQQMEAPWTGQPFINIIAQIDTGATRLSAALDRLLLLLGYCP